MEPRVGLVCRPVTADDEAGAAAVRDLRKAWTAEDLGDDVDDGYAAAFAAWWDAEAAHRRYWLAELDGEPVGMVSVVTLTRMPRPGAPTPSWGYVHNVFVSPAHRDGGVGAALMATVIDACRADGYQQLVLNPRRRSMPFYERLGFRPADHLVHLPL